ncbi:ion channel, partial [Escherichia coli]|uniref:ion channel n=1 Tax=Escherichia coli TaxID=562 RepID=UPI001CCC2AC4
LLIVLSGTLFYTKVEGWTVVDAFYFGVVSLIPTGVETGVSPITTLGKAFTIMYLIVGSVVMIGLIGIIAKAGIDVASK